MASTLKERIEESLAKLGMKPADLARKAKSTTATVSNWMNDMVKVEHVKAIQLFRMADALNVDSRWLLTGETTSSHVRESQASYQSQSVKSDVLRLSIQLVEEVLAERDLDLPPAKKGEAIQLAYDLLEEGLPQAKVLRFVLAAVA